MARTRKQNDRLWARRATKIYFDNEDLDTYLAFTMGRAAARSASVGESMRAAVAVDSKRPDTRVTAWRAAATQAQQHGDRIRTSDPVGATDAYLRASSYHRAAIFGQGVDDAIDSNAMSTKAFRKAADLMPDTIEPLEVAYDGWTAPGYFIRAAGDAPRPTILLFLGGETVAEDAWAWIGEAGVRRGWNTVVAEPPGWLGFRALNPAFPRVTVEALDAFTKPYVDAALARPEVDGRRLVAAGFSGGGFISLRATAHDDRIRALVADAPIIDFYRLITAEMPTALLRTPGWLLDRLLGMLGRRDPYLLLTLEKFRWQFGVQRTREWFDIFRNGSSYDLLPSVRVPVLALGGEGESPEQRRQAAEAVDRLPGPATLRLFRVDEGADAHTQVNHPALMQEEIFAWLGETLAGSGDDAPPA